MSLEPLQKRVAELLKSRRSAASFVGGAAVLNERRPRISDDLDIYAEDRPIGEIAEADLAALEAAGLTVSWRRDHYGFAIEAEISDGRASTLIEWSEADQERFFPVRPHPTFGWALNDVDLAVSKLIAASTRREARDICDLIEIDAGLSLALLALAAPAKFPGVAPVALLERAKVNAVGLPAENFERLRWRAAFAPRSVGDIKLDFVDRAERAIAQLALIPPDAHVGFLYLDPATGSPETPTRQNLAALRPLPASRRGAIARILAPGDR